MREIDRNGLRAPALVLDLDRAAASPEASTDVARVRSVWCLVREGGLPRAISFWDVEGDETISTADFLVGSPADGGVRSAPVPVTNEPEGLTVVICTRERPSELARALASLERQSDQSFRVLVIDNAPVTDATSKVVHSIGSGEFEYVVEPRPGLSVARNCAMRHVQTSLIAWFDDDEVADPNWIRRLREGFAHESRPVAVCGIMLPAELEHEAQVRFEQYGGFNKGRGLDPEVLREGTPSVPSAMYPLPAVGSGGNMAFRVDDLRSVGEFDEALGAGTRTHGGEETRALALLLLAGRTVLHYPPAITWHYHRSDMAAVHKQFFGYSAGLSAFFASMLRSRPGLVKNLLTMVPHLLRDLLPHEDNLRSGQLPADFPSSLLRAGRRGLLEGAPLYVLEALKQGCVIRRGAVPRQGGRG